LTLVLAWIGNFKNTHWFTLLDYVSSTNTLQEAILNFAGIIFPLATVVALGVVKIDGAAPWHNLFSKFIVKPSFFHWYLLHLHSERHTIFGVLIRK